MLNPAGTFSFAVGSLSAAAASGGAATGASFWAASLSGRPISGEPGGSGDAAGAGVCWAAAPQVNAPRNAPASKRLRGDRIVVMRVLPLSGGFDPHAGPKGRRGQPCRAQSHAFPSLRAIENAHEPCE